MACPFDLLKSRHARSQVAEQKLAHDIHSRCGRCDDETVSSTASLQPHPAQEILITRVTAQRICKRYDFNPLQYRRLLFKRSFVTC